MKARITRSMLSRLILLSAAICCTFVGAVSTRAADFLVKSPDVYTFNDDPTRDPEIILVRGATYTFEIDTAIDHPFYIYPEDGVSNNNISQGTITFKVPTNAVDDQISYLCSIHGFGNVFKFVDPPAPEPPPMVNIVGLTVSTNIVLKSTGTNNWSVFPEYSTDLKTTNWFALTVQTNRFISGTNETICGKPSGNPPLVFFRIRAQKDP